MTKKPPAAKLRFKPVTQAREDAQRYENARVSNRQAGVIPDANTALQVAKQDKLDTLTLRQMPYEVHGTPLNEEGTAFIPEDEYNRRVDKLASDLVTLIDAGRSKSDAAVKDIRQKLSALRVDGRTLGMMGVPAKYTAAAEPSTMRDRQYNERLANMPSALARGALALHEHEAAKKDKVQGDALAQAAQEYSQATPAYKDAELQRDRARKEVLQARWATAMRSQRPYLEQAIDLLDARIRKNEDFLAAQESPVE